MSTTADTQSIELVQVGEASTAESWLVSDWAAGQTAIMEWSPDNVVDQADGSVQLSLSAAPEGSTHGYHSGEVRSCDAASAGTWSWTAQAPVMQEGAVFGLFTYRADHFNDPWIEFDFEFVGADTTQVRLNVHMETATGEHVTLEQGNGWQPVIVDLGFDAALGLHTYEVTVTDTEAIFLVDGLVVGRFSASDMPYGTWTTGDMKGYANLWCVDPSLEFWAGDWAYEGEPLTATVADIDVRPGDLGAFDPAASLALNGDDAANELTGGDGDDILNGFGAADTLDGGSGNDKLYGGTGSDVLALDAGDDLLEGGSAHDWLKVGGTLGATVDLAVTTAQNTGYGVDTIQSVKNAWGGSGADRLSGDAGANTLRGEAGNDTLVGREGKDILDGGAGSDDLDGGEDDDQLRGEDGSDTMRLDVGDDTMDGGTGADWIRATGSTAVTIDLAKTVAQWTGFGFDAILNVENVAGGSGADSLYGTGEANILQGGAGNDTLNSGAGNDTMDGGTGTDRLEGSTGDDTYVVADAGDTLVELAGGGTDQVSAAVTWTLAAEIEHLALTGAAAINGTGNALANRLTGNGAANVLSGATGNDTLVGGLGNDALIGGTGMDQLTGGGGNDAFQFASAGEGGDVISDFRNLSGDDDLFRISAAGFGGGLTAGTVLSASRFQVRGDNLAQDADDRFILRTTDKTLWFDNNGNASGGLTLIADLNAAATMTSADIFLV